MGPRARPSQIPRPPANVRPVTRAPSNKPEATALEPAVLLVGTTPELETALAVALQRHRVFVETAKLASVVEAVTVAAPDLVLLTGDAAKDCGAAVLARLAAQATSAVVPVAILDDDTALDARLRAFRHGAVAVIPRSASIDRIADQIAELARDIPNRTRSSFGRIGEATLDDFVRALSRELRSGILSIKTGDGSAHEELRIVLGSGKPLADAVDQFVERVRRLVLRAEPLTYEFDERAAGTLQLFGGQDERSSKASSLVSGLTVFLADHDAARADYVAQELRGRNINVVVTDLEPNDARFGRLRQFDPAVLIIGDDHVKGRGYNLVRRMRQDTRLRWASLLVVRWDQVWSEHLSMPTIGGLVTTLADLASAEQTLRQRSAAEPSFDTRLELTGGARLLRTLSATERTLQVAVINPRAELHIDLSGGLVVGARGKLTGENARELEGPSAIAALLMLSSGRVRISAAAQPSVANVMSAVDMALSVADAEQPPLPLSMPAAKGGHESLVAVPQAPPLPNVSTPVEAPRITPAAIIDVGRAPGQSAASAPAPALAQPNERAPSAPQPERPQQRAPAAATQEQPDPRAAVAVSEPPRMAQAESGAVLGEASDPSLPSLSVSTAPPVPATSMNVVDTTFEGSETATTPSTFITPLPAAPKTARAVLAQRWCQFREWTGRHQLSMTELGLSAAVVVLGLFVLIVTSHRRSAAPDASAAASGRQPARGPRPSPPTQPTVSVVPAAPTPGPSCEQLLGDGAPRGRNAGAALEQLPLARRELVRGKTEESQRAYCRALIWDPENVTVLVELSRVTLMLGQPARAAEYADKARSLNPESAQAKWALGDALARAGDVDRARELFVEARGAEPGPGVYDALARGESRDAEAALRRRDYRTAERLFRRATVLDGENPSGALGIARSHLGLGERQEALTWAKRALELDPKRADAAVALGDALAASEQLEAAQQQWQTALELEPQHRGARKRLASSASPAADQ